MSHNFRNIRKLQYDEEFAMASASASDGVGPQNERANYAGFAGQGQLPESWCFARRAAQRTALAQTGAGSCRAWTAAKFMTSRKIPPRVEG